MYMNCLTSQQNKIFANHIIGIFNIKDILKTPLMMRKQQKSLHWPISHQSNQILHKKLRRIYWAHGLSNCSLQQWRRLRGKLLGVLGRSRRLPLCNVVLMRLELTWQRGLLLLHSTNRGPTLNITLPVVKPHLLNVLQHLQTV